MSYLQISIIFQIEVDNLFHFVCVSLHFESCQQLHFDMLKTLSQAHNWHKSNTWWQHSTLTDNKLCSPQQVSQSVSHKANVLVHYAIFKLTLNKKTRGTAQEFN